MICNSDLAVIVSSELHVHEANTNNGFSIFCKRYGHWPLLALHLIWHVTENP